MRYRARDLFVLPGLLSLSRIPLAVCFGLLVDRPAAAALVLSSPVSRTCSTVGPRVAMGW